MAQVICSILAEGRDQVLRSAARAAMAGADWIELRLDRWPPDADLAPVLAGIRLPVLVACRTADDGGHFRGTLAQRRELFTRALQAGAQGIDLEDWETWSPSVGQTRLRLLVRSHHNLTGVPKELPALQDKLFSMQCTLAKIVGTAHDLADATPLLDLMAATDQRQQPTVAFAMGKTAWPTRVLACLLGAPYVYASVGDGHETAPGQVPVDLLSGIYRVHDLGGSTSLYGLLGNPALHSLGPWLHNRAFRRLEHDGIYLPLETSRPEAVTAMLPRSRLRGLSVTAPYKSTMAAQCHRLDPVAAATGVVNTVRFEAHGMVVGHNTDVHGVKEAVRTVMNRDEEGSEAPAAVLGTGGGARAVAVALDELGYRVTIMGRSLDSAREFANHRGYQLAALKTRILDELEPAVVVHATPVGGTGRPDAGKRLLPDWTPPPGCIVLDLVYRPPVTRLLQDAQAAGARIVPGAEMFLAQAAAQVELFTGHHLPVAELRTFLAGTAVAGVS